MMAVHSLMEDDIGDIRAYQVLEPGFVFEQLNQQSARRWGAMRRFWRSSLEYRTREESGGEQETATTGTAGRDAVPPSLDFSDGDKGSWVGSPISKLPSDMHGSGSAGSAFSRT